MVFPVGVVLAVPRLPGWGTVSDGEGGMGGG